jgi:YD repeat-containing protein
MIFQEVKRKKNIYHFEEDRNNDGTPEVYFYGKRMAVPQYSYIESAQEFRDHPTTNTTNYCNCARLVRTSDSNIPLNGSAAGSVVGYDKVELLTGENGENGKTIFEYENLPDRILNYSQGAFPARPSPIPNIPFERNGMLLKQTDYKNLNGSFTKIREVTNINQSTDERIVYGVEKRNHIKQTGVLLSDEIDIFFYPSLNSTRTYVSKTTETTYYDSGEPFVQQTEYRYENKEHLQPTTIITTINNEQQEVTKIKYPADYAPAESNTFINLMKGEKHMHSLPVEKVVMLREDGEDKVLSKSIHEYSLFSNHLQKKAVYKLETNKPLDLSAVPSYIPSGLMPDVYKGKVTYKYDTTGNLIEVLPYNQPAISYLWAYQNSLPIAEIKNASYSEVEAAIQVSPAISFVDTQGETFDDASLRTKLDLLRERLPKAMISSYTYKPLEGISSFADPSGNISFFEYDDLGRLKVVKDHEGNIVKTYNYNYRVY